MTHLEINEASMDYDDRVVEINQALTAAREAGDRASEANLLNELGTTVTAPGRGQEALHHFETALAIAESLDDLSIQASIYANMGRAYVGSGLIREARSHYEQAIKLARRCSDARVELASLVGLTYAARQFIGGDTSLDYAQQSADAAARLDDAATEGEMLIVAGNLLGDMDFFKEAGEYFSAAMLAMRRAENLHGEGQAAGNLGMTYARMGDIDAAVEYLEHARQLFETAGRTADMVRTDSMLADIEMGLTNQFVPPLVQALDTARDSGDPDAMLATLDDLMNHHIDQSHLSSVIYYAKQKIELARQTSNLEVESDGYGDLGTAHLTLGNMSDAIEAQVESLRLATLAGSERGMMFARLGLFNIYRKTGDDNEAVEQGEAAARLAGQLGEREQQMNILGQLSLLYEKQERLEAAIARMRSAASLARDLGEKHREGAYRYNLGMMMFENEDTETGRMLLSARDIFEELGEEELVDRIDEILPPKQSLKRR